MKVTIDRAVLLKALGHVQSVVERRNTIPILSNVRFEAHDGRLGLRATDMDLEVVEDVPVLMAVKGATTVAAHTLYDIVRKLPEGGQVDLDATGGGERLQLACDRSRFTLATLPIEDFPVMTAGDLPFSFRLPAAELRGLTDRTRFAMSTEETRYYLNGIYLHPRVHDGVPVLRCVATDGHRLASVEMPLPVGAEGMPGVIIPRKTVSEVRRLIEDGDGEVEITLSATKIRFAYDSAVLTSKLIDGTFPDYERVIPSHNDKQLDVECKRFAAAVDRVSAISSDRSRAIKLMIEGTTLTLAASSPEHGSAIEEIEVQYQGEPMEIGFNARYLLDITQQIKGDSARFLMLDPGSPTVVHELGDASAIYVLMPMRV
jgi:DNA polymerase-3 subunit beta